MIRLQCLAGLFMPWTENPRVRGSMPRPGTLLPKQGNFNCPVFSCKESCINRRNELFLGNKPKTLGDLKTELQSHIALNKMRSVIVRADKAVIFDRVVQVLDVAKNAGVERLGVAIEEKPLPTPPPR
jgi:hypothetical protein